MEEFLRNVGVGLRPIDDPFFEDSYAMCKIFQRKGVIDEDDEDLFHEKLKEFPCHAAACKATFHTLLDFEMHYNNCHRYVCVECKKSLQNPRLLDIHIQENHDSFFQVLSTKQPMYQCYVSECDVKFINPVDRRNHCISVHKFPKNYRFDNASNYVKNQDKMDVDKVQLEEKPWKSKRVALSKNQKVKMFIPAAKNNTVAKSIVPENEQSRFPTDTKSPRSSLVFIPRQVKKSYTNALTNNENKEKNVLETGCMMDLADSLPD